MQPRRTSLQDLGDGSQNDRKGEAWSEGGAGVDIGRHTHTRARGFCVNTARERQTGASPTRARDFACRCVHPEARGALIESSSEFAGIPATSPLWRLGEDALEKADNLG